MENKQQDIFQVNIEQVTWCGLDFLRKKVERSDNYDLAFVSLATLAFYTKEENFHQAQELQAFIDQKFDDFTIKGHLFTFTNEWWNEILVYSQQFTSQELKAAALRFYSREPRKDFHTPVSLAKLATRILNIQPDDIVLDQCSGTGTFLEVLTNHYNIKKAIGVELVTNNVLISSIRAKLLKEKFSIIQGNVLTVDYSHLGATKVFSDYPWGMILPDKVVKDRRYAQYLQYCSKRSSEWAFLVSALLNQEKGGRTVIVALDGMLFRDMRGERENRERLSKLGRVEAIIALPSNLYYPQSRLAVNLLVFSQHNKAIKMVDARKLEVDIHKKVTLSDENIAIILDALKQHTEISREVSLEELAQNSYDWMPSRYLMKDKIKVINGVKLENLAINFHRGVMLRRDVLQNLKSDEYTDYQYLVAKDIQDGKFSNKLQCLKKFNAEDYRTTFIHKDDLLITRTVPFKLAVVPDIGEKKIMVNGNVYFIELDKNKVNPFYVMLYLNSSQGQFILESLTPGMALRSLSLKDLKSIEIPMRSMEEQLKIVEKYQSLANALEAAKKQEAYIRDEIYQLQEEVH